MRFIKRLFLLILTLLVICGAGLYYYSKQQLTFTPATITYNLKLGTTPRTVTRELAALGVVTLPWALELLARVRGDANHIKAGDYEIKSPVSALGLLRLLTRGDATQASVRFNEGWNLKQVRSALNAHEALIHDSKDLSPEDLAHQLRLPNAHPEGWIFPDTYQFSRGSSDMAVLRRAVALMQTHLTAQWFKRAADTPLASPYEALILASIIEKETGKAIDRPMVSSVFMNRLRQGMRLQTDPTVIYGMAESYTGKLLRRDLQVDNPWNTYTRAGLPPTPIAMPGLAALQAALHPADSKMFYFVARGDGTSQFSATLEEHNAAVNQYIRGARK